MQEKRNIASPILGFIKKNVVLCVALAAAVITSVIVPPDAKYIDYFDLRTLTCLFCVLAVVCALKNINFFYFLAGEIVQRFKNIRFSVLALVYITFIGSMLIANDMALLTFLPLGYFVLSTTSNEKYMAFTFIMQNIAANLGGMLTPFGNPQNLYLYSRFEIPTGEFMSIMLLPFVKMYVSVVNDINYINGSYAILFSIWGALYSFRIPSTATINAAALYKESRATNITNLILQIVLGVVLALLFGIEGALISMILAALHRNVSMALIIERKLISQTFVRSLLLQTVMCLIVTIAYYLGSMVVDIENITVASWITTAVLSAITLFCISIIVCAIIDFKTTKAIIEIAKNKLINR